MNIVVMYNRQQQKKGKNQNVWKGTHHADMTGTLLPASPPAKECKKAHDGDDDAENQEDDTGWSHCCVFTKKTVS